MRVVTAFIAGLIFAIGLGVAGMTLPQKVLAFLDVAGAWDPSLLLVMVAAIAVYMPAYWLIVRRDKPVLESHFALPKQQDLDPRLITGAVLFGVGWGIAGLCPGPAAVGLATLKPEIVAFFAAMLGGMLSVRLWYACSWCESLIPSRLARSRS